MSPKQLIETLTSPPSPQAQEAAWQALEESGEAGGDAVVDYFLAFDYESHDWTFLKRAVDKMGPVFLEKIAGGIQYAEHDSRTDELFELIEEMGEPAVPRLVEIMNYEMNGAFSANAAAALGHIGGDAASSALAQVAERPPAHLDIDSVMDALAEIGDANAKSILIAAITGSHEDKRSGAIWAMRGCPGPEFIQPLASALEKYDDYREGTIDSLAEIIDAGVIPVLESLKEDKEPDVRRSANKELGVLRKKLEHLERHRGADGTLSWDLALAEKSSPHDEVTFELSQARVANGVFSGMMKNTSPGTAIRDARFELRYTDHRDDEIKTDTQRTTGADFPRIAAGESATFSIPIEIPDACYDVRLRSFSTKAEKAPRSEGGGVGAAVPVIVLACGVAAYVHYCG